MKIIDRLFRGSCSDCCDGSDEKSGQCPNNCKEKGMQALQAMQERLHDVKMGLKAKKKLETSVFDIFRCCSFASLFWMAIGGGFVFVTYVWSRAGQRQRNAKHGNLALSSWNRRRVVEQSRRHQQKLKRTKHHPNWIV
jgi:hypothetical protein